VGHNHSHMTQSIQYRYRSTISGELVPKWKNDRWPDTHYKDKIRYSYQKEKKEETKKRA
jgi:hypothetical protein